MGTQAGTHRLPRSRNAYEGPRPPREAKVVNSGANQRRVGRVGESKPASRRGPQQTRPDQSARCPEDVAVEPAHAVRVPRGRAGDWRQSRPGGRLPRHRPHHRELGSAVAGSAHVASVATMTSAPDRGRANSATCCRLNRSSGIPRKQMAQAGCAHAGKYGKRRLARVRPTKRGRRIMLGTSHLRVERAEESPSPPVCEARYVRGNPQRPHSASGEPENRETVSKFATMLMLLKVLHLTGSSAHATLRFQTVNFAVACVRRAKRQTASRMKKQPPEWGVRSGAGISVAERKPAGCGGRVVRPRITGSWRNGCRRATGARP